MDLTLSVSPSVDAYVLSVPILYVLLNLVENTLVMGKYQHLLVRGRKRGREVLKGYVSRIHDIKVSKYQQLMVRERKRNSDVLKDLINGTRRAMRGRGEEKRE